MIDRALFARIRKCLALARSANEHEAANALAKARALMAEHGITDADLALAEVEEAAARGSRTQRPARWESMLCAAVRRALNVEVVVDEALDRRYFGRGATPEIAAYAFVSLFRHLKRARAAYIAQKLGRCRPGRKRIRADAFCEGWVSAVYRQIADLHPARDPDATIGAYIARRYGDNLATVSARSAKGAGIDRDHWRGFDRGSDVQLHQGMSGGPAPRALAHG